MRILQLIRRQESPNGTKILNVLYNPNSVLAPRIRSEAQIAHTQFFTNDMNTYCLFGTLHKIAIVAIALLAAFATVFLFQAGALVAVCGGLVLGALPATLAGASHITIV